MKVTVGSLFFESAKRHADVSCVRDPHRKPQLEMAYGQMAEQVRAFGAGLAAAGISKGDRVALFSDNRPRWLVADLGILSIGAVDVPRGSDSSTAEFEHILSHSGAIAAILQDKKLYDRLVQSSPTMKWLRLIVLMDDSSGEQSGGTRPTMNFSNILEDGKDKTSIFEHRMSAVSPDDLATIVYTSGTTGQPKGVMLTHANLTHQAVNLHEALAMDPGDIQLAILPSWHAYERAAEYYGIANGTTITYSDKRYIRDDLAKARPHLLPCVPRIWESVYDGIQDRLKKGPKLNRALFGFFTASSLIYVRARRTALALDSRRTPAGALERATAFLKTAVLWPIHALGHALIYKNIVQVTGGRLKAAVSGGGSLASYLDDFFEIVGVPILVGYGLTETAPVLTIRLPAHNVRGTVGLPIADTRLVIRDDIGRDLSQGQTGIIWAQGPGVMRGYYKNDEATDKAIDANRWFNTGDLGHLTITGDLAITGRAKDTIVLASGENVEPEPIEISAQKSPLIDQIIVVGQDQKVLGALVAPNVIHLAETLGLPRETDVAALCADQRAAKMIRDSIADLMAAQGTFKPSDQVSRISLIQEPFSEANGLLTQTLKPKRNLIAKKYEDVIAKMFGT